MTDCPRCHATNRSRAKFCTNCGALLTSSAPSGPIYLQPGQVMHGQYTIVRRLGKGAMGAVYLATQTIANRQRQVVAKEMLDYYDPKEDPGGKKARRRFGAEAATLVTLNFAGIPQIFDYFSEHGRNYIVMQFIEGRNLEERLTHVDEIGNLVRGRPYPAEQVRRWGTQVCKVLENLAKQNVVHMDIKPANLILDSSGDVWLVDFGTAKAQWVAQPGGSVGLQKSSVYGTAGYAPPEQYSGQAEPRSDVYALAATLYHLLADDAPGDHPFQFPQMDRLPGDLAVALKRALAQDVHQRSTATQFRQLLDVRPSVSVQPLTFPQNEAVTDLQSLADCCARHWDYARRILYDGTVENWLRTALHDPVTADKAQAIFKSQRDQDVGLDGFIRELNIAFPPPRLRVSTARLEVRSLPWQKERRRTLKVTNVGQGALQARVTTTAPWLNVTPAKFSCVTGRTVRLEVTAAAKALMPRAQSYTAGLTIEAGAGGRAQVPVTVTVPEPQLAIQPQNLNLRAAYQGETLTRTFTVRNPGGSAFEGRVSCDKAWVSVKPISLRVEPGGSVRVTVTAETGRLAPGGHTARLMVTAQAGGWTQTASVPASVRLPLWKTIWTRHKKLVVAVMLTLLILLCGVCVSTYLEVQKVAHYNRGLEFIKAGEWKQAAIEFEHCGQYRDAPEKATEMHYQAGSAYEAKQEWDQAVVEFERCGQYQDAPEKAREMHYQAGVAHEAKQEWEQAAAEFEHCGQYRNAPEKAMEMHYQAGAAYLEKRQWKQAIAKFKLCSEYKDALYQLYKAHYQAYQAYQADGQEETAATELQWLAGQWHTVRTLNGHSNSVRCVAFSPDGSPLASGSSDDTVRLWQVADGTLLRTLEVGSAVTSVAFSLDGAVLASGSWDKKVKLWRVGDGALPRTLEEYTGRVKSVAFSPDGVTLASASNDDTVRLWRFSDGTLLHTLKGHESGVESVAFSPDGALVASGSNDNTVRLWRASDGELLCTLKIGKFMVSVYSVAFSPDGMTIASGSTDNTLRLWRVDDGSLLHELKGRMGNVNSVAFSPDGALLASGSNDNTVRLWGVSDGKLLAELKGHTGDVNSVAFSPDGTLLASGSNDNTVRLWGLSRE